MNDERGIEKDKGNGVLPCISGSVSLNVALGLKKYHKEFEVEILEYKGLSETHVWVKVSGILDNIVKLNEKATHYKPSETRGI